MFCYENKLTYPVYLSNQEFKDCMDLLLISNKNKSQYVYIKSLNSFMFNKTKNKKIYFCKCCLQCFSSKKVSTEHRENYLRINGKQSVRLKGSLISFENISNDCLFLLRFMLILSVFLKKVESSHKNNDSFTKKYQDHIPCSFAYKVVCIDNKFSKKVVLYGGKNDIYRFIKSIPSEYNYCRKVIKKYFNKNLVMPAEKEERFQLSNICGICDKLFDVGDDKVRDHCHVTRK